MIAMNTLREAARVSASVGTCMSCGFCFAPAVVNIPNIPPPPFTLNNLNNHSEHIELSNVSLVVQSLLSNNYKLNGGYAY